MIQDPAFRSTSTVRIVGVSPAKGVLPLAVADLDGDGAFTKGVDSSILLKFGNGFDSGLPYEDLRSAIWRHGGTVGGKELAESLGGGHGSWMGFSELPKGLTHPIVDYVYRIAGDAVEVDYTVARSARVIAPEDGDIATLDLNGDGLSDPAQDAAVQIETHTSDGITFRNLTSLDDLTEAVRTAGGRVGPRDFQALEKLGTGSGRVQLSELGTQLDAGSGEVDRSLRMDESGLRMDFQIRD